MLSKITSHIEKLFLNSWWVLLFLIVSYFFYEQGVKKKNRDFAQLHARLVELQTQKQIATETQEDLLLQINSQSDPAWVELILMKGLGLVPEGQTKVFFAHD